MLHRRMSNRRQFQVPPAVSVSRSHSALLHDECEGGRMSSRARSSGHRDCVGTSKSATRSTTTTASPTPAEPDPPPPHATIPASRANTQNAGPPSGRLRLGPMMAIPSNTVAATSPLHKGVPRQGTLGINVAAFRAVVVIAIVPIPGPLARA